MTSWRVFLYGGLTSYRALFSWITPWIVIPTFIVAPLFQLLFFAYVGKDAGVGDNAFYLVGNGLEFASIPCLFAMTNTIAGERYTGTLGLVLVSPARRLPLFLGRAVPVVLNGFLAAAIMLVIGSWVLRVPIAWSAWPSLIAVTLVTAFSCTGLGLVSAGIGLRVRDTATLANILMGVLLVFCGVNVAVSLLPSWMQSVAQVLPMTHGIEAGRRVVAGETWDRVLPLVGEELVVGAVYGAVGIVAILVLERQSRRHATLEVA